MDTRGSKRDGYSGSKHDGYSGSKRDGYSGSKRDGYSGSKRDGYSDSNRDRYSGSQRGSFSESKREGYSGSQRASFAESKRDSYSRSKQEVYGEHEPVHVDAEGHGERRGREVSRDEHKRSVDMEHEGYGGGRRFPRAEVQLGGREPDERHGRASGLSRRDNDVVRVHGLRSTEAVIERRPEAVVRAYIDEAKSFDYGPLMSKLASHRVAYRLVPSDEMERVSGSRHHEGICLLVKPRPVPSVDEWLSTCPAAASVIVLDDVRNPHNLGAIIRMAAHFGVSGVWSTASVPNHGALARVAEGGTESVDIFEVPTTVAILPRLRRAGFEIVGASPSAETSLFEHRFPRRVAFVLGAEQEGLSETAVAELDVSLKIPGTGAVESLNVSVSAAVCVSEYARQRAEKKAQRSG